MALELALSAAVLLGGFFALVAGIGVLRLPDVLIRMHASTKAGTLATGLVIIPVAVTFGDLPTIAKCVLVMLFLLLTAPVGAHMIGRAAFRSGVPLWEPTFVDPDAARKLNATRPEGERLGGAPSRGAPPPA